MGLPPLLTLFLLYLGFKTDEIAGMILAVPIGLLFVNLYHYGAFKGITDSLAVLAGDIERFRRKEV
jgi:predicted PurR-regulated permease PerM